VLLVSEQAPVLRGNMGPVMLVGISYLLVNIKRSNVSVCFIIWAMFQAVSDLPACQKDVPCSFNDSDFPNNTVVGLG